MSQFNSFPLNVLYGILGQSINWKKVLTREVICTKSDFSRHSRDVMFVKDFRDTNGQEQSID